MRKTIRKKQDFLLSLAVFALIAFGLIMIFSVSKYYSLQITDGVTDKIFLTQQMISVAIGLVVWAVFQSIDYRVWQRYAGYGFFATLFLLFLPFLFGGGAERWINLGFIQFQPSELAKLTFVIYLAGWFSSKVEKGVAISQLFVPFICTIGLVALLMLIQKDLGTLSIFVAISAVVFAAAGATVTHFIISGGMAGFLLWLAVKIEPYRLQRILTFLQPEDNVLGTSYHIRNALIAIGSGGLWGLGFGQSKQKYLYLPEAHTDSIFAITAEELGFFRSLLIVIAFAFIAIRGYKIAKEAPDMFSCFLTVGITGWISVQAFINIAAMLSMVPLTGVPLPFVSYGGTSMIILLAAVGIMINISKNRAGGIR